MSVEMNDFVKLYAESGVQTEKKLLDKAKSLERLIVLKGTLNKVNTNYKNYIIAELACRMTDTTFCRATFVKNASAKLDDYIKWLANAKAALELKWDSQIDGILIMKYDGEIIAAARDLLNAYKTHILRSPTITFDYSEPQYMCAAVQAAYSAKHGVGICLFAT